MTAPQELAAIIRKAIAPRAPTVGLVLGSGLGAVADGLEDAISIDYSELPGFPRSSVEGHVGKLVCGRAAPGTTVIALKGRVHFYEGHDLATVVLPVRALVAAGVRTIIVTNAAGGVNPQLTPGEIVVIADHLNLTGQNPLRGPNDSTLGPRFPDMTHAYDPGLRELAKRAGRRVGLELREGVYSWLTGPSYETPAEIRMLQRLGADLAGMSTVPEVIAARHMGARILGLSCVTNLAAGLSPHPLTHDEVTATAARTEGAFKALLAEILRDLSSTAASEREP
jgi:purine-nucleoside phosphorylase